METEIPKMLNDRMLEIPEETFTFHSSRMRMQHVTPEELKRMDCDSDRCVVELADAKCDVVANACLVAIMSQGIGYHEQSESRLSKISMENGGTSRIVSSAGALVEGVKTLGAKKVSIITPYMKPLTKMVVDYLTAYSIEVLDSISLEISNNLEVGAQDPNNLLKIVEGLDYSGADAVVLSACVQMPSLAAIQKVEDRIGLPVLSAATSTVFKILKELELKTYVPNAGRLLSGAY
ncbi:Asp/Glu racemase [Alicyclobacillus tolerans]|nr:Asp/Glu racemase [Alicyclobacillus tolerans]